MELHVKGIEKGTSRP